MTVRFSPSPRGHDRLVGHSCGVLCGDLAQRQAFSAGEAHFRKRVVQNVDEREMHRAIIERITTERGGCAAAPTLSLASNTATAKPLRASKFAAVTPATPPPIITTGARVKLLFMMF